MLTSLVKVEKWKILVILMKVGKPTYVEKILEVMLVSSTSSLSSVMYKPHKANDIRWEVIQVVQAQDGILGIRHFRLLTKLWSGDIRNVYLVTPSTSHIYVLIIKGIRNHN